MLQFVEFLSSSDEDEENIKGSFKNQIVLQEMISVIESPPPAKPSRSSKDKENQAKKQEAIALIRQLNMHILSLEKEKKSQLYSKKKKTTDNTYRNIEEFEVQLNDQRKKEDELLKENLDKLSVKLEKFKRDKTIAQKSAANLEKLKILMEDVEGDMMQMKEKQRLIYEDLILDEKKFNSEIESYVKKFDEWSTLKCKQTLMERPSKATQKNGNVIEEQMPEEVLLFEKFLQVTNGHQGGWDSIDHQMFVKLHKQYKKQSHFLGKAIENIPTHTRKEIESHREWYEQYIVLREKKRQAIRYWKSNKLNEKDNLLSNANCNNSRMDDEEKCKKWEEIMERERVQRMRELEEWKAKKKEEEELQRKNEAFLEEEKDKMKIHQLMEEKRRLETKIQIQEYKLKKKEEDDILRHIEQEESRYKQTRPSKLDLERIKERNDRIVEQKRVKQLSAQAAKEEKEERLRRLKEKVTVNADRDPSRLLKPTEGWKRRQNSDTENKGNSHMIGARGLPHRAVPSWRQKVT